VYLAVVIRQKGESRKLKGFISTETGLKMVTGWQDLVIRDWLLEISFIFIL